MTNVLATAFILFVMFFILWRVLPDGWMTKVWAVVSVAFTGMDLILEYLMGLDWGVILSEPQQFFMSIGLGVGVIIARSRTAIRGKLAGG